MLFKRAKQAAIQGSTMPDLDVPVRTGKEPTIGEPVAKPDKKTVKKSAPFFDDENNRDRYMDLANDKRNWQIAWRITAALLAVSLGFNGKYQLDSKYIPWVIQVDQFGHVVSVGPVDRAKPMDIERVIRSEMIEWVENTRRVISDQAAQKDYLRKSYARVEEGSLAKKALDKFIADTKPFETAAMYTKQAEVKYALKRGDSTFEVEWSETLIAPNGDKLPGERWKGVFTFKVVVPETEAAIRANGAGFYITDFQWQKVVN